MIISALKRSLGLAIALLLAMPVLSFGQTTAAGSTAALDIGPINIKELTNAQTFRYGRELYRKGNYAEAASVFQRILKNECTNRLAQYHLQKISRKGNEFSYLKNYLDNLPCEKIDFNDEDFLPASFYYEKDNDLLLEQLVVYNKRYRNNKTTLSAKINEYSRIAARLETRVNEMMTALTTKEKISAETIAGLKNTLSLAQNQAKSMDSQVSELNKALTQAAIEKEHITATQKKSAAQEIPPTAPDTTPSAETGALSSLQIKFAGILERLQEIEHSINEKNQRIQILQKNLEPIQY